MAPPNKSKDVVNPAILDAIRVVIQEENKIIYERLDKIEQNLSCLSELATKVDTIEASVQFVTDQVEDINATILPNVSKHTADVACALSMYMLDIDVHRRKWSLLIHGVKGQTGEDEAQTRQAVTKLAKQHLRVADADTTQLSACHRLSQQNDAGIIVRFCDLAQRNAWLNGARHLRNHPDRISISPDLPPVLRKLKQEMLELRRTLTPDIKAKSHVRYLKQWPYVELRVEGRSPQRPQTPQADIVKDMLKLNPLLVIRDPATH